MTESANELKKINRFSMCTVVDLEKLTPYVILRNLKKGEILFSEGKHPESLTVIKSGYIKVYKQSKTQSKLLLIFGPGSAVGEVALNMSADYPATAQCLTDSQVLFFPKALYILLKNSSLKFLESVSNISGTMALSLGAKQLEFTEGEAEERVISFLSGLFQSHGQALTPEQFIIPFSLSRNEVASAIGVRAETISRILSKFNKSGDFQTTDSKMIGRISFFNIVKPTR